MILLGTNPSLDSMLIQSPRTCGGFSAVCHIQALPDHTHWGFRAKPRVLAVPGPTGAINPDCALPVISGFWPKLHGHWSTAVQGLSPMASSKWKAWPWVLNLPTEPNQPQAPEWALSHLSSQDSEFLRGTVLSLQEHQEQLECPAQLQIPYIVPATILALLQFPSVMPLF